MLSAHAETCIFLSITNKNALERVARAATLLPRDHLLDATFSSIGSRLDPPRLRGVAPSRRRRRPRCGDATRAEAEASHALEAEDAATTFASPSALRASLLRPFAMSDAHVLKRTWLPKSGRC
jgi:hypothetical protein